jgi:hypothetical protein
VYKCFRTGIVRRRDVYTAYPDHVTTRNFNRCVPLPRVIPLDREFGWFIGAFLAEGCLTDHQVHISNNDPQYHAATAAWPTRHGINFHLTNENNREKNGGISISQMFHSTILVHLMRNLCGNGSWVKRVPAWASRAPREFILGLLDGYICGDGHISPDRYIIAQSRSPKLRDGIALLFATIGVHTTLRQNLMHTHAQNLLQAYRKQAQGLDPEGLDPQGLDPQGLDPQGLDPAGFDPAGLDPECLDPEGSDQSGDQERAPFYRVSTISCSARKLQAEFTLTLDYKQTALDNWDLDNQYKRAGLAGDAQRVFGPTNSIRPLTLKTVAACDSSLFVYDLTVANTRNMCLASGLASRDTFHQAGVAQSVMRGVPRMRELFDVTKSMKKPVTVVRTTEVDRDALVRRLAGVHLTDVVVRRWTEVTVDRAVPAEPRHARAHELHRVAYPTEWLAEEDAVGRAVTVIVLAMPAMRAHGLVPQDIRRALHRLYNGQRRRGEGRPRARGRVLGARDRARRHARARRAVH